MSDSDFIMWRQSDGTWHQAPYNNGAGGCYTPANEKTWEYFELCLAEKTINPDGEEYLLFHKHEMEIVPLITLRGKRLVNKNGFQIKTDKDSQTYDCPGLDESDKQSLASDKQVKLACTREDATVLVWLDEGGRDRWLLNRAKKAEEERQQREQKKLTKFHDEGDHFINPYTFVPLPEQIDRNEPLGHEALKKESVSGWFTWQLSFKTPLVYPLDELPTAEDGSIRYPGSALRGALRNLHESLTGSCLRVIDADFVPVHREPMSAGNKDHTLAVVREVDPVTGAVTMVELTDQLHWVAESLVHKVVPSDQLRSGCLVHVDTTDKTDGPNSRKEIRKGNPISKGDDWVLHLSDTSPIRDKKTYFVAAARLTEEFEQIDSETWDEFKRMCAGSQDLIGQNDADRASDIPIRHKDGHKIGNRRKVDGTLSVGDTVWLTGPKNHRCLKMATIWRYLGKHAVAERVNPVFLPCHDPNKLCPSCSIFGSVDTRPPQTSGRGGVEQAGYASHVRVGWASSTKAPDPSQIDIAPLRAPKPSSGGFYLTTNPNVPGSASKDDGHIPHAHWGSNSDKPLRQIRGRKFYWHGQVQNKSSNRQTRRDHQTLDRTVTAAQAGLVLEARVSFDNLSLEQLGWLLAAANPGAFLQTTCLVHIGRGKSLGFGSAEPQILGLHVETAQSRYSLKQPEPVTAEELIALVRENVPDHLLPVHEALKRVLAARPENVPADRIWYPTTGNFRTVDKNFDESFKWFANHAGGRTGNLMPLPDVTDANQYLPAKDLSSNDDAGQKANSPGSKQKGKR